MSVPTKIASLDYKELAEKCGSTSGSDMVNGLTYKENKVSETQENPIMKPVEKRKATGKLAEIIKEFNELPCDEKIRKISETRVEMEKEAWLEKACEWLENHNDYQRVLDNGKGVRFDMTQCVIDFRKAMEE